jgi:hypothetical protein
LTQSRFVIAGTIAAALALTALPLLSQTAPAAHGPGHYPPLPKPVNLKILPKDISSDDLIKIMRGFAGSLGVKCEQCHVRNPQTHHMDFASDAKDDKQIARIMMKMSRDINENFTSQVKDPDAMPEDKHVSCGTCHRGHKMPAHFIPPKQEDHMEGMPPAK